MKKTSLIIISLIIILHLFSNISLAQGPKTSPYSLKADYLLYKERVQNICNPYKTKKEALKIEDNYEEINGSYDFDSIKNTHRTNMNNIYKCALLSTQKKSLILIKEDLIKKNPNLSEKVKPKIKSKIEILDRISQTLWCINSEEKNSIIKQNILKQTTYQTCKYLSYLEYLKEQNEKIAYIVPEQKEKYSIWRITTLYAEKINKIDEETEHTYKVFPLAFQAFTEYENNIWIHFLLELLKENYIIFREKLHEVLNPINQVVYKISNAMRK